LRTNHTWWLLVATLQGPQRGDGGRRSVSAIITSAVAEFLGASVGNV
jgi:hypothetical protein